MPLKTFSTPLEESNLGMLLLNNQNGIGFTLEEAGTYKLRCSLPWYHATSDSLAPDAMTAVDAGTEVTVEVAADTPVTWYVKTAHTGELVPLTFKFTPGAGLGEDAIQDLIDEAIEALPEAGVTSDADDNTVAGTGAGSTLTAGSGTKNSFYGKNAGNEVTTGDKNIMLGYNAGKDLGNVSAFCALGSADAPINNLYIPSDNAKGVAMSTPMTFQDRTYFYAANSAPTDANIEPGGLIWYRDESGDKIKARIKYGDGSFGTAEIAVVKDV